jgi:hypothetical protein
MRKIGIAMLVAAGSVALGLTAASAGEFVHGYYRSNGTYVHSYHRSSPDSSYNNNWSVRPNVNPYTGQEGTRSPTFNDRAPNSGFGSGTFCGLNC